MSDCVIIGAGLIGMLTARELMAAGMRVTLLEKGQPARESSWAGGGILSPLYPWRYADPVNELARWSQQVYPQLCQELQDSSGVDPQWTQSGLLILDVDDPAQVRQWAHRFGVGLELVDDARAGDLEPRLGLQPASAAWMPGVAQVRNPRLAQSLRAAIENSGAVIRSRSPAQGWVIRGGRVTAVRTAEGNLEADYFVVAGGAWSAELLESTGLHLPIQPVRGQMILFQGPPGLVTRITLYQGRYVIPRRDGRVLVGSTLEYVGFDKRTTEQALHDLKRSALELIPALASQPVEQHWAGLRPGSPDGVPIIGPHPELGNLFINTGHFRNGVVLGPASARLLADTLAGRPPILDPVPYLPDTGSKNP